MSTSTPPRAPGPIAPPDEKFWERYSPHYEFPLSSVGSALMHVGALVLFIVVLRFLADLTTLDTPAVPMTVARVTGAGETSGVGSAGSEGGAEPENVDNIVASNPSRPVPEAALRDVQQDIKDWMPKVPSSADAPRLEDLPNPNKLAKLNQDLRKKLLQGNNGDKGMGDATGKGENPQAGAGTGGTGDGTSSPERAVRWELIFTTENSKHYLKQLAAMNATLVFRGADGVDRAYSNVDQSPPTVKDFRREDLPGLYFVDDSEESATRLGRELGLNFRPKFFIAFFPKEVEDDLAAKERRFRDRKESEIFSTKFKMINRDGKITAEVVEQVPVRR